MSSKTGSADVRKIGDTGACATFHGDCVVLTVHRDDATQKAWSMIMFRAAEWEELLASVKAGKLDLPKAAKKVPEHRPVGPTRCACGGMFAPEDDVCSNMGVLVR